MKKRVIDIKKLIALCRDPAFRKAYIECKEGRNTSAYLEAKSEKETKNEK